METINKQIETLEKDIDALQMNIASSKFMPPEKDFALLRELKGKLFSLYDQKERL